jgi:hypothetical protein
MTDTTPPTEHDNADDYAPDVSHAIESRQILARVRIQIFDAPDYAIQGREVNPSWVTVNLVYSEQTKGWALERVALGGKNRNKDGTLTARHQMHEWGRLSSTPDARRGEMPDWLIRAVDEAVTGVIDATAPIRGAGLVIT